MLGGPPNVIPDHLTAEEFYSLGTWYYDENDFDKARQALEKAIACDENGATAHKARNYLWRNIPKNSVPKEAILECKKLQGALAQPDKAAEGLEKLLKEHPSFEWPYKLMADLKLRKGDTASALELLRKSLDINSKYPPALTSMALAHAIEMEYAEARKYLNEALLVTPDDQRLIGFRRSLEILAALDEPERN